MAATYPHLKPQPGVDLTHENPRLLSRLEALGRRLGKTLTITSGYRSYAKQKYLYEHPASHPGTPAAPPGGSLHEAGLAADVTIDGTALQSYPGASRAARIVGLYPLAGDAPHVQLVPPGTSFADASKRYGGTPLADKFQPYSGTKDIPDVAAGGVAGHVTDPSKLVVQAIAAALGTSGSRLLIYTALLLGGAVLVVAGISRATGLDKKAAGALKTSTKAAAAAVIK